MANKKKKPKTIGEMSNSRMMWSFNPSTKVKGNKKGKGAYTRKAKHKNAE